MQGRPIKAAVEQVLRVPLRGGDHAENGTGKESEERGFFAGPDECAAALLSHCSGVLRMGTAFGREWPYVEVEEAILAPGLPAPVTEDEIAAPDGAYRRVDDAITRESAGRIARILRLAGATGQCGHGFDVLWFGDGERYLLAGATLEISNLFAEFMMPATRDRIEKLLIRERRAGAEVLEAWRGEGEAKGPSSAVVRRSLELIGGADWRDPATLLGRRPEVERVAESKGLYSVSLADGKSIDYSSEFGDRGWVLRRQAGTGVFQTIALSEEEGLLRLKAVLDSSFDVGRAELRARVAFDLNADLVALGRGDQNS